jgi:hypothetical protein
MLFNSIEFITVFLPVAVAGFFLLAARRATSLPMAWLVLASLVFYSWWDYRNLFVIVPSVVGNYLLGWAIKFLVDRHAGVAPQPDPLSYALLVSFFPHVIAGPIVNYDDLLPQFRKPSFLRFAPDLLADGLRSFCSASPRKWCSPISSAAMPMRASVWWHRGTLSLSSPRGAACLASLPIYGVIFGVLVHKPLTVGVIDDLLRFKEDYAARATVPKLIIFAGSNARFSHRCETIEKLLSMPCVNFGVGRGIGLDYLFDRLEPLLKPGDVVYMPLEYEWYLDDKIAAMTGPDAELMFFGEREKLLGFGGERMLRAFFSFDLRYLVSALSEMALQAIGVQRRVGLTTMTPQGDEAGHTAAEAVPYRAYLAMVNPYIPTAETLAASSYVAQQLAGFFLHGRGDTGS